jgi:carbonic anhydrase/acetyltransferase-like protein (isoleucine patch superfamily)
MHRLPNPPLLLAFEGVAPVLHGPPRLAGAGSAVLGRVTIGGAVVLGPHAVLRGDGQDIHVGSDVHFGSRSTVHIAHKLGGTLIGDGVTVGANAVVHACTLGDGCLVGDGVVVLDGASVGPGSAVAAGSVAFPRSVLPAGMWCSGMPAVAVRPLAAAELKALHERQRAAVQAGILGQGPGPALRCGRPGVFVAATASGRGALAMEAGSSLWFGCLVEAGDAGVDIATGSNVQDNSVLIASAGKVKIGADCTVGHNVRLSGCTIGARALVGMGSVVAVGTQIADDVMLAAGSTTDPGQWLESGWLWGGRPARPMSRLDERRRALIQGSAVIYRSYAREFAASQAAGPAPAPAEA